MSQHTAAGIESQTLGSRYTKEDVHAARCRIAANVADVAMDAWESWSFNRGSVEVTTAAGHRTTRPWLLGRFACTGMTTGWDGAIETCRHPSNRHEGLIIVQFAINPT